MFFRVLLLIIGACAVWKGATAMVNGSTRVARFFAVPRLMVGLTVIAIGTSLPELSVGIFSVFGNDTTLSLGNIIGANFLNICVVLGLAAVIHPVTVKRSILVGEAFFVVLALGLVWVLGIDGILDRFDGILLLIAYSAFWVLLAVQVHEDHINARVSSRFHAMSEQEKPRSVGNAIVAVCFGMALLVIGARFLVDSAIAIAVWWGVPSLVIGLTLVSLGTVLPEMVTSIISSKKHVSDLNVGNVFGGVVFNTLCIIGIVSALRDISVPRTLLTQDIPLLLFVSVIVLIGMRSRRWRLVRWEGIVLIAMYVLYVVYTLITTPAVH